MKKILLTFISALLIGCNTTAPKPKTITVDGEPEGHTHQLNGKYGHTVQQLHHLLLQIVLLSITTELS